MLFGVYLNTIVPKSITNKEPKRLIYKAEITANL
jgi:hypothetical protein